MRHLEPDDALEIKEKGSGKSANKNNVQKCYSRHTATFWRTPYLDGDFLFSGQRGVLSVPFVDRLVRG